MTQPDRRTHCWEKIYRLLRSCVGSIWLTSNHRSPRSRRGRRSKQHRICGIPSKYTLHWASTAMIPTVLRACGLKCRASMAFYPMLLIRGAIHSSYLPMPWFWCFIPCSQLCNRLVAKFIHLHFTCIAVSPSYSLSNFSRRRIAYCAGKPVSIYLQYVN